jgi:hypothetical protein
MRSLVAQRLPFINVPHVRVCPVGSVHHAWRTFTVSRPLRSGLWLLRRLRPPSRTLAFSCPTRVGLAVWEFPSSSIRDASDPSLPPRRRVPWGQRLPTCGLDRPRTIPLWVWGVSAIFTPPASRRFQQRFLASASVTGLEQSAAYGSQELPFSSQASDPRRCHPLTPAAESSYRCPCMVL